MNINIKFIPEEFKNLDENEVFNRIELAKSKLGNDLLILCHHYQIDQIIQFADLRGDSLALARQASKNKDAKYLIFCGVHFMAESADMLTNPEQHVILPDIDAGCSMADMAELEDVLDAWNEIINITNDKIIPITYINSSANLKAFCGEHDGAVCTSSNAQKVVSWAFEKGDKLFFFPDQHLGRNTAYKLGISLQEMIIWDPHKPLGGNTKEAIKKAKVILWYGFCSIHQLFRVDHIRDWRNKIPDINILVHPECSFDVVNNADLVGSTDFIIKTIDKADNGSKWAIGTEINLVNRLKNEHRNLEIYSLSPFQCLCTTMFRIRPPYLLYAIERLLDGEVINQIKVEETISHWAKISLDRMLSLS